VEMAGPLFVEGNEGAAWLGELPRAGGGLRRTRSHHFHPVVVAHRRLATSVNPLLRDAWLLHSGPEGLGRRGTRGHTVCEPRLSPKAHPAYQDDHTLTQCCSTALRRVRTHTFDEVARSPALRADLRLRDAGAHAGTSRTKRGQVPGVGLASRRSPLRIGHYGFGTKLSVPRTI
jgi:hypothetical protein